MSTIILNGCVPYDYQCRLAGDNSLEGCRPLEPTSSALFPCEPRLITIPTDLGKTAAVAMASAGSTHVLK